MKKFILSILTFCCTMVLSIKAENTNVSSLDNVVYIEPVSIAAGSQYTLSVKMKNAVEAEGFGFDLYLPSGISVATDEDGLPLVELSTERTTKRKTNSFDAAFQSDGCLRVLAASTNASTISGHDGEICLITILVAANVIAGDYPMILRNIAISDTEAKSHRTDMVESTITIIASGDNRIIFDEVSTTAPEAAIGVDVRIKRSIKAGEWSTICLPFSMTVAQVKEAFGSDVALADFTGYVAEEDDKGNISGLIVNFSDVDAIEANHPYLIKVSTAINEFTVDGVDVEPEEEPTIATVKRTRKQWSEFIGTYTANTVVPEKTLFLSGNKFYYSTGATKMKAFRGYFDFYDVLTEVDESYDAKVRFFIDDTATNIEGISSSIQPEAVYSVSGVRMGRADRMKALPKGLYIVNGKKVYNK